VKPFIFGDAIRPRITVDGLRSLLADLRKAGKAIPKAIILSEYDRRELNQDMLAGSVTPVAKEDQTPEHDGKAIAVIEGVPVFSHRDVSKGKARLIYPPQETKNA